MTNVVAGREKPMASYRAPWYKVEEHERILRHHYERLHRVKPTIKTTQYGRRYGPRYESRFGKNNTDLAFLGNMYFIVSNLRDPLAL